MASDVDLIILLTNVDLIMPTYHGSCFTGGPFWGGDFLSWILNKHAQRDHLKALLLQFSLIMDVAAISTRMGVGLEDFPR